MQNARILINEVLKIFISMKIKFNMRVENGFLWC